MIFICFFDVLVDFLGVFVCIFLDERYFIDGWSWGIVWIGFKCNFKINNKFSIIKYNLYYIWMLLSFEKIER